jgi:hypothetical protein
VKYVNLRDEEETGTFGPYLTIDNDDIVRVYHEPAPDPKGEGFWRNLKDQLERAVAQGFHYVELDNLDTYDADVSWKCFDEAADRQLSVLAKNPRNVRGDNTKLIAHRAVAGIIVEKDCGTASEMHELRQRANKPDLPVWFVSFAGGRDWARATAQDIQAAGFANMGVTYSRTGEYGSSGDVLLPSSPHIPQAAAFQPTGATGMDTTQAQTILSNIGLLDPPADGALGPVTKWALSEFCGSAGVPFDGATITDAVAQALAAATPRPLAPGNDLAGRIVSAMQGAGQFIARHRDCLNIVYVEGLNPDGTPNGNRPNYFDSVRCLIRIGDGGVPKMVGIWEATTEPSRYWTEHPMNSGGAARIAFGQYKSWVVGDYHGDNALVQAADITVYRDSQRLYKRYGAPETGEFGIHQHHGYNYPKNDEGRSSAGCLVGRLNDGHEEFMALVKTDARYRANPNYKFMTGVLSSEAVPGVITQTVVNRPAPAAHPGGGSTELSPETIRAIVALAASSPVTHHDWHGRGVAAAGYIKGMAVTFGLVCQKFKAGDSAAQLMAQANTGNDNVDALSWYNSNFHALGMSNDVAGLNTLRHLFVLLLGLGMRESSGNCFEGRDMSAGNTSAETAEAGLFQQSHDSFRASPELAKLMAAYQANPSWGFQSIFREGVSHGMTPNLGNGPGAEFQGLCKVSPSFAVEAAAVGLRVIGGTAPHGHWGPISRKEAELRPEADALFLQVQQIVEAAPAPIPSPVPVPVPPIVITPPAPVPTPTPAPAPPPYVPDPVASALDQLIALFRQRLASMLPLPLPMPAPVPAPAPPSPDLTSLVQQLMTVIQGIRGQSTTTSPLGPDQQLEQLRKLVEIGRGVITPEAAKALTQPLGQVNGALGQTIGNLLDGKKTAFGVIGAVVTAILQSAGPNVPLNEVMPILGSSAGLGSVAMPLFLALSAWGALGKMEKWAGASPQPPKTQ